MPRPSAAVVIPTYNRSTLLRRTLAALAEVDYDTDVQIVVVDDGSDRDHAAANRAAAEATGVQYIDQPNAGPATARNRGVAVTQSALVLFLDDDCAPAPDWLRRLADAFVKADGSLGGLGGAVKSQPPHNWVSRFCAAAEYSTGVQPEFTNADTANACFPRHVLEEVGGFDERFRHAGGEDPDLSRRIREAGYRLQYVPEAVVQHAEIDRFRDYLLQLYRRGVGEARVKRKEGRLAKVAVRSALFPLFCLRRAGQTWRISKGKASVPSRAAYAFAESLGALAFVTGGLVGLVRG